MKGRIHWNWSPHFVVALTFLILLIGFGFNGLYGQDSHEYLRYAKDLRVQWDTGQPAGDFFWPKLYSGMGAIISYVGINPHWVLLAISLLAMLGMLWWMQKIFRLLYGSDGTLLILLGAVTQVYFVRLGFLVMTDALCGFWLLAAFYHFLSFEKNRESKGFVWFLVFALLAVLTRYAAAPILVIPVMYAVYFWLSKFGRQVVMVSIPLLLVAVIAIGYLNNHMLQHTLELFNEWSWDHVISRKYTARESQEFYWVPNIIYAFSNFGHLGYLSLGVFLLPFYRKLRPHKILLVSVIVYLIFIAGLAIQNQRFLFIVHPLVLVLLFPAFDSFKNWLESKRLKVLFITGTIAVNSSFFVYSFQKTYAIHRVEIEVVRALEKYDSSIPVYAFYVDQSFKSYDLTNEVRNLWMEEYTTFEHGALVVYNAKKFENWKGSALERNWHRLTNEYSLEVEKQLNHGWTIYRIK